MRPRRYCLQAICLGVILLQNFPAAAQTENWPRWRGPRNDGTSTEKGIAAKWSKTENVKWRLELPGPAPSTPIIWHDRIYLQLLHANEQIVLALEKNTGREIWKHARQTNASEESLHSYATPFVYRFNNQEFLLTHGADYIVAHDLKDGHELWRSGGLNDPDDYNHFFRFVASPVASAGLIVVPSAKNGPVLGINPKNAKGDITNSTTNFYWKLAQNTPDVPSPLIHNGLVYLCRENGVLLCLDAVTGKQFYAERTHNQRHRGSPVYADGKIYLTATDGTVTVVKAGKQFELIAQNTIAERLSASPAISGETIYLRSYKALYAIGGN